MNDLLNDRLHEATDDLAARLRSGSAVRAAATRRRQRRRALAGAVAAVAVGVVATSVEIEDDAARLVPAVNQSSSPAPSTAPTSKPSPGPSGVPSPGMPSPTARPTRGTGRNLLAGFHFREESTWRPTGESTVDRSDDLGTEWALNPCRPTAYPTDAQRLAMASLRKDSPEQIEARQLAVYRDAATAGQVMSSFRSALAACASSTGPYGETNKFVTTPLQVGDEGLVIVQSFNYSGTPVPGGTYVVVVRDGRSVYLAMITNESQPKGQRDAAAIQLVAAARKQLPLPQPH